MSSREAAMEKEDYCPAHIWVDKSIEETNKTILLMQADIKGLSKNLYVVCGIIICSEFLIKILMK